jgi:hypothetical protein
VHHNKKIIVENPIRSKHHRSRQFKHIKASSNLPIEVGMEVINAKAKSNQDDGMVRAEIRTQESKNVTEDVFQ